MRLRPYQDECATFLYENDRALVLAPVGAGKTCIALTGMKEMIRDGHAARFLVVAPKRVCTDVWPVEGPKWAPELSMALAVGSPAQRAKALAAGAQITVINYDTLQKLDSLAGFDGIVFDELTRLKNPSGKRFKAIEKLIIASGIEIRWGLTGSFTANGLEDVFGQVKIVSHALLGSAKTRFLHQYFMCVDRDFGIWEALSGSLEKVMARIRSATFVLDPGVYKDKLPPCHFVPVEIELDDRGPYDRMRKNFVEQFPDEKVIAKNAGAVTSKLTQMASGFSYGKEGSAGQAHWFSSHKFDRLDEIVAENQRAPTLLIYNLNEELAELKRRFGKRLATIDDKDVVERWNRGEIELFAIHPKSAGHGLNLQYGGCKMVFVSLPWSLELFEQTVGRLHRGGQTMAVWVYVLLTQRTIDTKIWDRLQDRRGMSDVALEELRGGS